jgi:hypothetical protein
MEATITPWLLPCHPLQMSVVETGWVLNLETYFQRSLCLERHFWVNQVGPVRCAYGRPVLLFREI